MFKLFKRSKEAVLKSKLDKMLLINKSAEGADMFQYDYLDSENRLVSVILKHIFTDKKKNKYYEFVNPIQMTMERNIAASVANKEFWYNMTVQDLNKICDEILTANNARDYNTIALKTNEIKTRSLKLVEYDTTMRLGAIYFLMEGEHPGRYNPLTTTRKIELWKEDEEARNFFLQKVWDTVRPYTELSSSDLLDYLTAMEQRVQKKLSEKQPMPPPVEKKITEKIANTGTYSIIK